MSPRVRNVTYDVLRVVATLGVIGVHVSATLMALAGDYSGCLWSLDRFLLRFSVPIFFFVSGALVWAPYDRKGWRSWAEFLGGRSRVVLLPYLAWSMLYWFLGPLFAFEQIPAGTRAWFGMLVTGGAMYHLYFIPILMAFYFVTPVAKWLLDRSPAMLIAAAMILNFGTIAWLAADVAYVPREFETVAKWASLHLPYIALGAVYGSSVGLRRFAGLDGGRSSR